MPTSVDRRRVFDFHRELRGKKREHEVGLEAMRQTGLTRRTGMGVTGRSNVASITSAGIGDYRRGAGALYGAQAGQARFDLGESEHGQELMREMFAAKGGRSIREFGSDLPATPGSVGSDFERAPGQYSANLGSERHERERLRRKRRLTPGILPDVPTGRPDLDYIFRPEDFLSSIDF